VRGFLRRGLSFRGSLYLMASVVTAPPKPCIQSDCVARIANQRYWEFSHFFCWLSHFRQLFSQLFSDLKNVRSACATVVFDIFAHRPRQFARFSHYFSHFRAHQVGDWFDTHCAPSQPLPGLQLRRLRKITAVPAANPVDLRLSEFCWIPKSGRIIAAPCLCATFSRWRRFP